MLLTVCYYLQCALYGILAALSLTRWFKTSDALNNSDSSKLDEAALKTAVEAVRELDKQTLELKKRGYKRKISKRAPFLSGY